MSRWKHTLDVSDVFHNDHLNIEEKAQIISTRIGNQSWYKPEEDGELAEIVDELKDVDEVEWFDSVWDGFYDWADFNDVWVKTY